jgi:hypothetical protein
MPCQVASRAGLSAKEVAALRACNSTAVTGIALRKILRVDTAHGEQVRDAKVLRSRDGERCLIATVVAGDVDTRVTGPAALRRKIATVRNAARRLQRQTRQPRSVV